jgi:hypothetical protein
MKQPTQSTAKLYPICHGSSDFFASAPLRVDAPAADRHFWDPMMSRLTNTGDRALESAPMPCAGSMMITTIITMTTRERGAFG